MISAILTMMCLYYEKLFSCCCSCCSGTGPYVGVFDICNPDKEFKLHNGEVVPVDDDDEPEINNKMFDQDVEALKNDNGLALGENEIEMRKPIEDLAIENLNAVDVEAEMNEKNQKMLEEAALGNVNSNKRDEND